jgi:putative ATP-binding cassette transporter
VLLTKPLYTVLDEATSALDHENEALMYRYLLAAETTLISVTHHAGLASYHSQVLQLGENGSWRLRNVEDLPPSKK